MATIHCPHGEFELKHFGGNAYGTACQLCNPKGDRVAELRNSPEVERIAEKPSPRARDDGFFMCSACGRKLELQETCWCRQVHPSYLAAQQQANAAASEKERERLRKELEVAQGVQKLMPGELEATRRALVETTATLEAERRELENLKREHQARYGDAAMGEQMWRRRFEDLETETAFLQRELDRERAKNKRRGL